MELLAESGHPDTYRELLKFYRLRNITGEPVLRTAKRFWEISGSKADSVLWNCVRGTSRSNRLRSLGEASTGRTSLSLRKCRAGAGEDDVNVGCDLAESYDNVRKGKKAGDVLLELVEHAEANPKAITFCLRQLREQSVGTRESG